MPIGVATSSATAERGKGEPVLREQRALSIAMAWLRRHPAPLLCFSYKNPGKPDGVNYIRTDEEVRKPGDGDSSRKMASPKTGRVPGREI